MNCFFKASIPDKPGQSSDRFLLKIAVLSALLFSVFIPSPAPAEQIVEGIVALITIKAREPIHEIIFYSDLERYRLFFAPEEEQPNVSQRLNQVIHQALLKPEARRFILQEPALEAVRERLEKIRHRFENDAGFEHALRQTGLLETELEEIIRESLRVEQLLDERIKGFIFISPKSIKHYFQEHPEVFKGKKLAEVARRIETFLISKKETVKKAEYLQRIKAKAEISILLK